MARKLAVSIPRFALTPPEAAAALGVGPDFFEENVAPELRLIRRGRKRLVPVAELERWVAQAASATLADASPKAE
jgi:excisionase family DNA binding protein